MTENDFEQRLANVTSQIESSTNLLNAKVQQAIQLIEHYENAIVENNIETLSVIRQEIITKKEKTNGKNSSRMRSTVDLEKLFYPK